MNTIEHLFSGPLRHGISFSRNCNIKFTWLSEVGVTIKCEWCIVALYIVHHNYVIVISWWMSSTACKLYVGHRSMVFVCCSAVQHFNSKWPMYSVLLTVHVRTVCVWRTPNKTIRHGLKDWLPSENIVGGTPVESVVSHHYPIFGTMQEYCRRLLVLPDTSHIIPLVRLVCQVS